MACNQPDCDRPARSRGMCESHYRRQLRRERPAKVKNPEAALEARRAALAKALETRKENTRDRLAELAWLVDGGVWPPTACARLDWSLSAALKSAYRYGRPDLAAVLEPHKREQYAA